MFKVTSRWAHQDKIKVEWNLGKRCNYDCSYCPSVIHDNSSPHTDIKILKLVVDKLASLPKNIRISFTGGEPAVHPKIEELLDYCKEKGISWINLTSNGTRTHEWYLNQPSIDHIVFSLHFEYDWNKILDTITNYSIFTQKPFFVNVMAHHQKMEDVRTAVTYLDTVGIKYAVRRIRWTEADHNIFDDLRYDADDLTWLLEQDATADYNCVVDNIRNVHANDVIKLHMNKFKGWSCSAGVESLMINWDGDVHRATCRVGGSLGNIYDGTFLAPVAPITCSRDWCTCAADIPLTKFNDKNNSN
jgi:MoaA/NifB/PqqE/SkfB family radical SAM enzyme